MMSAVCCREAGSHLSLLESDDASSLILDLQPQEREEMSHLHKPTIHKYFTIATQTELSSYQSSSQSVDYDSFKNRN